MGYVHDTHMAQFIDPNVVGKTSGTWTPAVASNVPSLNRTAADAAFTLLIPVPLPSNDSPQKGAYLKSIDVYYSIGTADCDDFATVELEKIALTATGSAITGTAVTTTCDSAHDSAAKRKAQGSHTLTVTLTTPEWIDDSAAFILQLVVDAAATTVFKLFGARANYTLRV